jgi:hypothetical protein
MLKNSESKTLDLSGRETQVELMSEASRAPSVHNVQPAIWAFVPEKNQILLYADPTRRLPIGDASGNDNRISLGASFEGMKIALSRHGLKLGAPVFGPSTTNATIDPMISPMISPKISDLVASAEVSNGADTDSLALYVSLRASYRGKFVQSTSKQRNELKRRLGTYVGVILVSEKTKIRSTVEMGDEAAAEFMNNSAYAKELFQWLRLSPKHPGWNRDGLNADALALSKAERPLASLLMRPQVFGPLAKLGLTKILIAESPKGVTADALIILTAPQSEDAFETGRRFYRVWLEACAAGYSLCPISALADSRASAAKLVKKFRIPNGHRIVNVFRAGIRPPSKALKLSPRLPATELLRKILPC